MPKSSTKKKKADNPRSKPEARQWDVFKGRVCLIKTMREADRIGRLVWVDLYTLGMCKASIEQPRPEDIAIVFKHSIESITLHPEEREKGQQHGHTDGAPK